MGILPRLPNANKQTKSYQVQFGGLNHTIGATDSEIYNMKNLSSDHYPVLSPREKRKILRTLASPQAMICYGEHIAWVDGTNFYCDGEIYGTVTAGEKSMAVLTDRIIIMPDKKYFDIRTAEAKGQFNSLPELKAAVKNPDMGDVYIIYNSFSQKRSLYYWDGTDFVFLGNSFWPVDEYATFNVKFPRYGKLYGVKAEANTIQSNGVDWSNYFRVGDAVTISGCTKQPKNNKTAVIREIDGDKMYFYENVFSLDAYRYTHVTTKFLERTDDHGIPKYYYFYAENKWLKFTLDEMEGVDYIEGFTGFEAGRKIVYQKVYDNTKWELCSSENYFMVIPTTEVTDVPPDADILDFIKIGADTEEPNAITITREMPDMDFIFTAGNRLWGAKGDTIYGSKLGDPLNFNVFDGLATDSYSVDLGTPGDATAGIEYNGYPIFFKEDGIFKLYGDYPQNFQMYATMKQGVRKGCGKSLVIAGDILYYVSRYGVMAYSGGVPTWIGEPLGKTILQAVAAGGGQKYYLSAYDGEVWDLYVYDANSGIWHREDDLRLVDAGYNGAVIGLSADGRILSLSPDYTRSGTEEEEAPWMVEFADMVFGSPNRKGIGKMQFRFGFEEPGEVVISVKYDSGEWEKVMTVSGGTKESRVIPLIPRRCDHFKIRLESRNRVNIYGMTVHYYHGSEL